MPHLPMVLREALVQRLYRRRRQLSFNARATPTLKEVSGASRLM